jgi:UDP-N-acetylglucosamine 2-epimerase
MFIVGARPQFIKHSAISPHVKGVLVHTGQHHDYLMSRVFFDELGLPEPDYNLNVNGGLHGDQTGRMLIGLEPIMQKEKPCLVVVYGDTNSTLAGALVAAKLSIPVAHVEAGHRCYDHAMPEELNRVLVDHLSTLRFCTTNSALYNLKREGLSGLVVGDVMLDALLKQSSNLMALKQYHLEPKKYYLATIHRAENTDNMGRLKSILEGLQQLPYPVVLPLHPRTANAINSYGLKTGGLIVTPPLSYSNLAGLTANSLRVFTDSGGLQKEAYWLGVPCSTLRRTTEAIETVTAGWNVLVDADKLLIIESANITTPKETPSVLGEPGAGAMIASILKDYCGR